MGKYLPDFRYDVFLSYAHVDEKTPDGKPPGWVTEFKHYLEWNLARKLGREDDFEIFMDDRLNHSEGVTPQLMENLGQTAILLVVMSPGYASSNWCQRELKKFLETAQDRTSTRIIVVEREPFENERVPTRELVADRKKFQFWAKDEQNTARVLGPPARVEQPWYDRCEDVASEIQRTLDSLLEEKARAGASTEPEMRSVYLAHVTDDLESHREAFMRRLDVQGIHVLPYEYYPMNPAEFREAASRDIARCDLYVQLLSGWPGKGKFPSVQFDLATEAGIEILQWRSPDLDLAGVADPDHLGLLNSATVRAQGLENFKKEVIARATHSSIEEEHNHDATNVFVCTDPSDNHVAESLIESLTDFGVECSVPTSSQDPSEFRADLNAKLKKCDGLIVAFENAPLTWVDGQLNLRNKICTDRPLPPTAIYAARKVRREDFQDKTSDIPILDGSESDADKILGQFVEGCRHD